MSKLYKYEINSNMEEWVIYCKAWFRVSLCYTGPSICEFWVFCEECI